VNILTNIHKFSFTAHFSSSLALTNLMCNLSIIYHEQQLHYSLTQIKCRYNAKSNTMLTADHQRCSKHIGPVLHGKIAQKISPGGNFLIDGDRETFAPGQFIHDRRL